MDLFIVGVFGAFLAFWRNGSVHCLCLCFFLLFFGENGSVTPSALGCFGDEMDLDR